MYRVVVDGKIMSEHAFIEDAETSMVHMYHNGDLMGWVYSIEQDGVEVEISDWVCYELMK